MADEVNATPVASKSPWQSKTILFNAIVGIFGIVSSLGFIPSVGAWVQSHADIVLTGIGALGVGLRFLTKGKISIE